MLGDVQRLKSDVILQWVVLHVNRGTGLTYASFSTVRPVDSVSELSFIKIDGLML